MIYVFDTSPLIILSRNFYRKRFPTLWEKFDSLIANNKIISTRESFREIEEQDDDLYKWAKLHEDIFEIPNIKEAEFIKQIYAIPHFRDNIEKQKILKGGLNADPFVIAKAFNYGASVVTLEKKKPNAAKIPNICEHFNIICMNLEKFMEKENWSF